MIGRLYILFLLLGTLLLAACGGGSGAASGSGETTGQVGVGEQVSTPEGSYTRVSVPELQAALEEGDPLLVNTHVPFEGDISGTDRSIPYDEIEDNLDLLPVDRDERVVLYCMTGSMSEAAAETLVGLGYTNLWDLEGGMEAWQAQGLPLEGV